MAPQGYTRRKWPLCPMCESHDIFDIDATEQGELFYCQECGHQWRYQQPSLEPAAQQSTDSSRTIRSHSIPRYDSRFQGQ
jgi:Zn ribbon nucleic-acid-binding protein